MMRIAHLTTVDSSLRYLLFPQLVAAIAAGHEVVGVSAPGPDVPYLEAAGIRHIPLTSSTRSVNPLADGRAAAELWRILRRERFDVLHTHNPKPGLYGRVIGRLARVPIVVHTTHGLYATTEDKWRKRGPIYALEALASRCSDAELVQNPEDLETMARLHIARRGKLRLLGNGISLDRFNPQRYGADERLEMRRGLGIDGGAMVVGTVGRLVAEKGYRELLAAADALGPEFVLVIVGPTDPSKPDALPADLIETSQRKGVRFLGHREDVDGLYAAMDIFVLASYREGFPRAAMEAAAMGLPVVATDIRGCRQVVEHGVNGFLVPVRDSDALAAAIRTLGGDAALRRRMGVAGRAMAQSRFDELRVVETVLKTYAELTAQRPRGQRPIALRRSKI